MNQGISLAQQALWPIVVLVGIIILRQPLARLLGGLAGRVSKVSVLSVTVEFAEVPEAHPRWTVRADENLDFRGLTEAAKLNDSTAGNLVETLVQPGALDFAVIDLGRGQSWLTTRLYLFSLLLERLRNLRCLVFVTASGTTGRFFLGVSDPADVRNALVAASPWLDAATESVVRNFPAGRPRTAATSESLLSNYFGDSRSIQNNASYFAQTYLHQVQTNAFPQNDQEWLQIPTASGQNNIWEHASWIAMEDVTSGDLKNAIRQESGLPDSPGWRNEDRVRAVVERGGRYVALLDPHVEGRFARLIDRHALLEQLGTAYINEPASR